MPVTPLSNVLQYPPQDAEPLPDAMDVDVGDQGPVESYDGDAKITENPDGSAIVDLNPQISSGATQSDKFDANLALEIADGDLNRICTDLLEGIARDNDSRKEHLDMLAEGMKLLGLVIENQNNASGTTSAPLEGMSTVRHPLLLEACQLFQANAFGELLPSAGPVKVRDDRPAKPTNLMGHNGGPPLEAGASPFVPPPPVSPGQPLVPPTAGAGPVPAAPQDVAAPVNAAQPQAPAMAAAPPVAPQPPQEEPRDELATALEKDFNHYLTSTAAEYVPDTDQMLFKVGFGGLGIKKVYNCPLRRRPVSESIDIEDFIVSNALTTLSNAGRITHRIKMRPSILTRMQLLGVYRDIPVPQPTQTDQSNPVDQAKADIAGVQTQTDPRDTDHELYECYCELNLKEDHLAPKEFRDKGLALPYRVTIEKEAQKILEIRRNWKEDDDQCMAKEYFVDFPYIRAFGFYCIGLLHILGNTTKTLTAAWRELIDSGMFANFPGFLYLKGAGRQLTNQFRVPPGGGVALDSTATDIKSAVMPLPYKDLGPAFTAFVQHVEELGQRLGGTAQTAIGEGKQDAPVGTTMALIEQQTKPVGAVQKRLHNAQAKEFALLKERFKEDPEAFWRFNKRPSQPWARDQFVKALEDYDFVPVSDPNNPTQMHRAAKADWLKSVAIQAPGLLDSKKVFLRAAAMNEINDVEELLAPPAPPQGPQIDPAKMADVAHKNAKLQSDQAIKQQDNQSELQIEQLRIADRREERANDLQIAQVNQQTERLKLASTVAIHGSNLEEAQRALNLKILGEHVGKAAAHAHDLRRGDVEHQRAQELADRQAAQAAQSVPDEAAE